MSVYSQKILATSGITGYWKLDETSGTIAQDSKGSLNLTYAGDYTLNQEKIADGKSVLFGNSGGNEGKASSTSVPTEATANVTLEAWIVCNDVSVSEQVIVSNGNDDLNGYALVVSGNGTTNGRLYALRGGVAWHDTGYRLHSSVPYHVVMTIDGSNVAKVYVNAVLVKTISGFNPNTPSGLFTISGGNNGVRYFNGRIDEVAIYTAELGQLAIQDHYEAVRIPPPTPSFVRRPGWPYRLNQASPQSKNLVLWWPGYPYTPSGVRDLSTRYINVTARLAESLQAMTVDPHMGHAFKQGSSQHWGSGVVNGTNTTRGPHSVAVWANTPLLNPPVEAGTIVSWGDSDQDRGLLIFGFSERRTLGVHETGFGAVGTFIDAIIPSTAKFPAWHHYCCTYDETHYRLYFDGVEVARVGAGVTDVSTKHHYIGRSVHDGFPIYAITGTMTCDYRFYNEPLPPEIVRQMVHEETRWDLYLVHEKRRVYARLAISFALNVDEKLAADDSFARQAEFYRAAPEGLGLGESSERLSDANRNYTEPLGLGELFGRVSEAIRSFADVAAAADDVYRQTESFRGLLDEVGLAEVIEKVVGFIFFVELYDFLAAGETGPFSRVADALRWYTDDLCLADAFLWKADAHRLFRELMALIDRLDAKHRFPKKCDVHRGRADEGCETRARKVR